MKSLFTLFITTLLVAMQLPLHAEDFSLRLQHQIRGKDGESFTKRTKEEHWKPEETAIIICDTWDYHHCLNAVKRLEEFAPRMNEVISKARDNGAVIIHAPSDCMPAYEDNPARKRAIDAPKSQHAPRDIAQWRSRIPSEVGALYPIDQSDGGEDDDPAAHTEWAAKLTALGRNPKMPWEEQSKLISIDADKDYISDKGDEVWNILEARGVKNVILMGVHTNMCVLGRPFGLRQMAANGKNVVLLRDMTDCMYNPKQWPYVDHFTGNDLVMTYVERYVCPTVTSDQILGGAPFRFSTDTRKNPGPVALPGRSPYKAWTPILLPKPWAEATDSFDEFSGTAWYRCIVRLPKAWVKSNPLRLSLPLSKDNVQAWINGVALTPADNAPKGRLVLNVPADDLVVDEAFWLILKAEHQNPLAGFKAAPLLESGENQLDLSGQWQFRIAGEGSLEAPALPAKFGGAQDYYFEAE